MDCSTPGFPVLHYLPKFAQTHVHWVGDAIQPSHPLLPPSPALNLSQHQGLFQWVGPFCIRWPRYCSFRFSISPSDEYSGLISLRTDWFDCCESEHCSVMSNSLWPRGLYSPWNSPGQNTGVGSLSLLQGIFPTQVPHIPCRFFTNWATREVPDCCGSIAIQDHPLPKRQFRGYVQDHLVNPFIAGQDST